MKAAKLKPFKIGYGDEMVAFYLRMPSAAELDEFTRQISEASANEDTKYQKLFDVKLKALAEFSEEMPKKAIKEKGETKYVDLVENPESSLDALTRYFGERTPEAERIIAGAYNTFLAEIEPEGNFI